MLPHARSLTAAAACAAVGFSIFPPSVSAVVGRDWQPTTWTGVADGAPVPGEGLSAPMPGALPIAEALPIAYDGQSSCDPSPKPGAMRLDQIIKATYGASEYVGISRGCDVGGRSEHKEGRAVDWMVDVRKPEERAKAEAFLNWLLGPDAAGRVHGNADMLGVMYIGWHDRMWRGYKSGQGWAELKGCFSKSEKTYDNHCHRNHIHISLTRAGAAGSTVPGVPPGSVVPSPEPAPEPVRPPAPAQPGEDNDAFMAVGAEIGYLTDEASPLESGEVRTVDLPPVPLNASSALVTVTTRDATKKGSLRIGMVDAKSAVSVKVPKRKSRTTVLQVPVAGGAVQLSSTGKSPVQVQVDVLGYTAAGGDHRAVGVPATRLVKVKFSPAEVSVVNVRGVGPVPKKPRKSTAVILRVTTKGQGSAGRVAAYPVGGADLGTRSAGVAEKGKRSTIVVADIGDDGLIALASDVKTKATFEIIGYVTG